MILLKQSNARSFLSAEYSTRWYRAKVQKVEEDTVNVLFADYGDSDDIPRDKIREFPIDKFFELPLQAIECKLDRIKRGGL